MLILEFYYCFDESDSFEYCINVWLLPLSLYQISKRLSCNDWMLELKQEDEYKHKLFKTCLTYVFPESAEFHWVLFGRYHDSFVTGFQSYEF